MKSDIIQGLCIVTIILLILVGQSYVFNSDMITNTNPCEEYIIEDAICTTDTDCEPARVLDNIQLI